MRTLTWDAMDGRKEGMTLEEVETFCATVRKSGADGKERIKGAVTIGGKLYQLKVALDGGKPESS